MIEEKAKLIEDVDSRLREIKSHLEHLKDSCEGDSRRMLERLIRQHEELEMRQRSLIAKWHQVETGGGNVADEILHILYSGVDQLEKDCKQLVSGGK